MNFSILQKHAGAWCAALLMEAPKLCKTLPFFVDGKGQASDLKDPRNLDMRLFAHPRRRAVSVLRRRARERDFVVILQEGQSAVELLCRKHAHTKTVFSRDSGVNQAND